MRTQHLGTSTLGVWTRQEALAVTTRGVVQSCLRRGEWQVLLPGVYADGGFEPSHVQWAFAAVLACGGPEGPMPFGEGRRRVPAVVAGRDAARLWGSHSSTTTTPRPAPVSSLCMTCTSGQLVRRWPRRDRTAPFTVSPGTAWSFGTETWFG